jgi:hypothetical protein
LEAAEKKSELDRRYQRMAEEEAEMQRQFEEQERARAEEEERQERNRQAEFERRHARKLARYPMNIRKPTEKHLNETKKFKYTVWTSSGYDHDGYHSYEGAPQKEFNSSYNTLEEANQRVKYVFWFENPWGLDKNEMHVNKDKTDSKGLHRMEVHPDDSE